MNEIKNLMEIDEKIRALIGLYKITEAKANKYRTALLAIRDNAVNVAALAEEALKD